MGEIFLCWTIIVGHIPPALRHDVRDARPPSGENSARSGAHARGDDGAAKIKAANHNPRQGRFYHGDTEFS